MTMLVAGIGNVFLGDDGFGVEVVRRLEEAELPDGVDVADYGIRGVHLAYELLDGRYDTLVLVDAVPLGDEPGTVALLDASDRADAVGAGPVDAHSMSPDVVLRSLKHLGGHVDRVLVVGCQPAVVEERMGLSEPVAGAVEVARDMVLDLAFADAAVLATTPLRGEAWPWTRLSCSSTTTGWSSSCCATTRRPAASRAVTLSGGESSR